MKKIERIYNTSARSKLVINSETASIIFKKGASAEECQRIERFLVSVIEKAPSCKTTLRGHLGYHKELDVFYIVLNNISKTVKARFSEQKVAA